ncbi:MAG: 50S ribosomal protein L22 [Candidatus Micrarchaeota archaeon]
MGLYKYSMKAADEREFARAQAYDLNCSYKDLSQVLAALKGKTVAQARKVLDECISLKMPIAFHKFHTGMGHRSQLGGRKGKFPKKEAKIALALLKNAESNADFKGLDAGSLVVVQAASFKQNVMPRYRRTFATPVVLGYGKQAIWANYVTARAEIVLGKPPERKRGANGKNRKAGVKQVKKQG